MIIATAGHLPRSEESKFAAYRRAAKGDLPCDDEPQRIDLSTESSEAEPDRSHLGNSIDQYGS